MNQPTLSSSAVALPLAFCAFAAFASPDAPVVSGTKITQSVKATNLHATGSASSSSGGGGGLSYGSFGLRGSANRSTGAMPGRIEVGTTNIVDGARVTGSDFTNSVTASNIKVTGAVVDVGRIYVGKRP